MYFTSQRIWITWKG